MIKGIAHLKIRIHSLPTHPHPNGRSGKVFLVLKTPLEFHRTKTLHNVPAEVNGVKVPRENPVTDGLNTYV